MCCTYLFETFCCSRYEINKLFNHISKYKLVHFAPTIAPTYPLFPHKFVADAKNLYVFISFTRLVLLRFEIVEHECDAISFVFIICSIFGLILVLACSFFLYRRTFPQILGNDFTSKKAHKAKMIRKPLPSASFTIRCLAYVPRFWLYESPAIVINFCRFANACRRLLVVGSFCTITFETWSTIKRTITRIASN